MRDLQKIVNKKDHITKNQGSRVFKLNQENKFLFLWFLKHTELKNLLHGEYPRIKNSH